MEQAVSGFPGDLNPPAALPLGAAWFWASCFSACQFFLLSSKTNDIHLRFLWRKIKVYRIERYSVSEFIVAGVESP